MRDKKAETPKVKLSKLEEIIKKAVPIKAIICFFIFWEYFWQCFLIILCILGLYGKGKKFKLVFSGF